MCWMIAAAAVTAATSIASYNQQRGQASAQRAYNSAVEAQQDAYRRQVMDYQNQTWAQDIDYSKQIIDWQQKEFSRQEAWVKDSQKAINQDYFNKVATLLQRQIEEGIAAAFNIQTVERQARAERAKAANAMGERGVEGNSVEAVVNDILRQEGEATTMVTYQLDAVNRQLGLEQLALKAGNDQALSNLAGSVRVYNPIELPKPPAPVNPVAPAAPVPSPSGTATMLGVAGTLMGGVTNQYAATNGGKVPTSFNQAASIFKL